MIDIAMTAAVRPEVVERTLKAARNNLMSKRGFRLVVDVAPVGEVSRRSQQDVEEVIRRYFPHHVVRTASESLYTEAMRWAWETVESDWVIQLEDDWEFTRPVDMDAIIDEIGTISRVGVVLFDRVGKSVIDYLNYRGVFEPVRGPFWRRVKGKSLGGPPALMRREYMRGAAQFMDNPAAPDVISARASVQSFLKDWEFLAYVGEDGKGGLVKDIGKEWKRKMGLKMEKRTPKGVQWSPA